MIFIKCDELQFLATATLRAGLQHHVERCLRGATQSLEAATGHHLAQPRLTGLGSKREPDFLRHGRGRAHERGSGIVNASDGIEVRRQMIMRERLDDHPRAIRLERSVDMGGGARRVAHVVKAIEECDEVVGSGIALGGGDVEPRVDADAGYLGRLAGALNRRGMIVEADEARNWGRPVP